MTCEPARDRADPPPLYAPPCRWPPIDPDPPHDCSDDSGGACDWDCPRGEERIQRLQEHG